MTYAMTFDNSWEVMTEDEMYEVNGGISFWTRLAVIGAFAASAAVLTLAIVTFNILLGAAIMKLKIGKFIAQLGVTGVAAIVLSSFAVSVFCNLQIF